MRAFTLLLLVAAAHLAVASKQAETARANPIRKVRKFIGDLSTLKHLLTADLRGRRHRSFICIPNKYSRRALWNISLNEFLMQTVQQLIATNTGNGQRRFRKCSLGGCGVHPRERNYILNHLFQVKPIGIKECRWIVNGYLWIFSRYPWIAHWYSCTTHVIHG